MRKLHFLLGLFLLLHSSTLFAAPVMTKSNDGISLAFEDDVYIAGGDVVLREKVGGDLFVAGGTVRIEAPVEGDILIGGGTVDISAAVGDDIRVAGGVVRIRSTVESNVIVVGGNITVEKTASIGGDLLGAVEMLLLQGTVEGDTWVSAERYLQEGTTKGLLEVHAQQISLRGRAMDDAVLAASERLDIDPHAALLGDLRYWVPEGERTFGDTVKGTVIYDDELAPSSFHGIEVERRVAWSLVKGLSLYAIVSGAFVIALLMACTRKYFRDCARVLKDKPWMSMLWGFLYFAATPVVILLLFMTLVGVPLALFVLFLYVFSFVFAKAVSSLVLARFIELHLRQHWGWQLSYAVSVGCFVLLTLLLLIPFVGWLLLLLIVFTAFGASLQTKVEKYRKIL